MKNIFFFTVSLITLAGCNDGGGTSTLGASKLALIYKSLGSCSADQGDAGTPAYGFRELPIFTPMPF